jgi:hypothetical protein
VDGGLPAVLSQTFRSLIHSRMLLGLKTYEQAYPNTDILMFEPDHSDSELYLANTFSYSQRRHMAEHAYQQTRQLLRSRQSGLSAKLSYHGIAIKHAVLDDSTRHLCPPLRTPTRIGQSLNQLHSVMDKLQQVVQRAAARDHAGV